MTALMPSIGFGLPVSGAWATAATMVHVARRAEELGFASLWTFQRLLCPPGGRGDRSYDALLNPAARAPDDPAYRMVHDPVVPLAYVAGHTERIGLGTATMCAPFTPPALLAKTMASLDQLSGGRVTVGLGIGWLPQEYAAAGIPFERRGARMEEYLRCWEALWTEDPVEFAGEFYAVPRSHLGLSLEPRNRGGQPPGIGGSRLRPVQRPRPPVLLGGQAPSALRRAGRRAEGWIASTGQDPGTIESSVELVREGAREAGRDPGSLRFLARAVVDLTERDAGAGRAPFQGTRDQVLDDLVGLGERGITEVLVDLNFSPRVGSPDVDPGAATAYAERVLDALAPATLSRG